MSEELIDIWYKQCDHKCDKCPFSSECTHYEPTESGMVS